MHSERALSASALLIPLVLALHSAILFFDGAGAGFAERQVFMNALRSSPFISPSLVLQSFIFCCCEFDASVFVASVLVSAAYAPPQATAPASPSASSNFMEV